MGLPGLHDHGALLEGGVQDLREKLQGLALARLAAAPHQVPAARLFRGIHPRLHGAGQRERLHRRRLQQDGGHQDAGLLHAPLGHPARGDRHPARPVLFLQEPVLPFPLPLRRALGARFPSVAGQGAA